MRKVKEMQIEDTYHTKAQRLQALGDIRGVQDLLLRKIQEQAETHSCRKHTELGEIGCSPKERHRKHLTYLIDLE